MASSSEEGPQLSELSRALDAMAATRRGIKAKNIGLLDLIKGIKNDHENSPFSGPSSAKPSNSEAKTHDDLLEMGLVIVKSRQTQNDGPAPSPALPPLESNPTPVFRRDIASVRLYEEEAGGEKIAFELIEANPSPSVNLAGKNQKIRYLNVVRDIMDFHEFKEIALKDGNLVSNPNEQLAVQTVLQSVEDKMFEKNNNTWFMKPGTLLRCDVDHNGTFIASATFMSIPYVQSDSLHESPDVADRDGVCMPRRLDEITHLHDSELGSELSQIDKVLWVGEIWMITVNDTGILTYGRKPCQDSLFNNIEIKEFEASSRDKRMIQVTELNGLQFQIPIAHCATLMVMQTALQYQLEEMKPDTDSNDFAVTSEASEEFTVFGMTGERMTSWVWSRLVHGQSPVLHVKLEPRAPDSDSGDSIFPSFDSPVRGGSRVRDHTEEWVREQTQEMQNERASQSIGSSFEDVDFARIARSIDEDQHEADGELRNWDLDAASPPIFAWGSTNENMNPVNEENDMRNSIEARLLRAEVYLGQFFPKDLPQQEAWVLSGGTSSAECTLEMFKEKVHEIMDQLSNANGQNKGRFQEQKTLVDYHDLCKAAIRFLEAFVPKDFSSPGLHKLFGVLYKGFKSPEIRSKAQIPTKWVILSRPGSGNGIGARNRFGSICYDCLDETIYNCLDDAFYHLSDQHYAELPPGERLERHVTQLSIAAEEKFKHWTAKIVKAAREQMENIAQAAGEIQDAAAYADQFHHPTWVILSPLLEAFELTASFVLALSHTLDETSKFFESTVYEVDANSMILNENALNLVTVVDRCGDKAEKSLRNVQRPLASLTHAVQAEDLVKLFVPVGFHELATQMACNLLTGPVHVNPDAAEPYQTVKEWQQQLLGKMRLVLSKNAYNAHANYAQAQAFRVQEYILDQAEKALQDQPKIISSSLEEAKELRDETTELVDITDNDKSVSFEITFGIIYGIFLLGNFTMYQRSMHRLNDMHFTEQIMPPGVTAAILAFFETAALFLMAIALPWYAMKWYMH